mmetsp:Transcript_1890/g.2678  ORF Transcript_1890/g.2678 Transcript_1890/m.2678 type:complete len:93 (-) Transcript_1890:175-453(-)
MVQFNTVRPFQAVGALQPSPEAPSMAAARQLDAMQSQHLTAARCYISNKFERTEVKVEMHIPIKIQRCYVNRLDHLLKDETTASASLEPSSH